MVNLIGTLSRLKPFKVLVVGDFMLDRYTHGKVGRISPEAPVPVLHVQKEETLPGGAGNVALNLASLGAHVSVLGRIGSDPEGDYLKRLLFDQNIDAKSLLIEEGFHTPIKNRLLGGSQQMLRIDFEVTDAAPDSLFDDLKLLECDLIAVSDYNKGFLTPTLLDALIAHGHKLGIPIIVDPKGDDFSKYTGATLIKPNLKEAYLASKLSHEHSLQDVAQTLLDQSKAKQLLITRSSDGLSLFDQNGHKHFPVRTREVQDVTGAGDTVLAMLAMALANGLNTSEAAHLANVAAGLAIERLGCAKLSLADIAERLLDLDVANKVFDEEHLYALEQTLFGKTFTILGLDSKQGMTTELFTTLKKLSDDKLILYIRDDDPDSTFIELLASLHEVDFIVLSENSLSSLCERMHPTQSYLFESGKLESVASPAALI